MVGVMSGAVTNTPGLGAAQQTLSDTMIASGETRVAASAASSGLASAYAVAYPIGVLGVIFLVIWTRRNPPWSSRRRDRRTMPAACTAKWRTRPFSARR